jgi:hypothetical protein
MMRKLTYIPLFIFALICFSYIAKASPSFPSALNYRGFSINDTTQLTEKKFLIYVNQGYLQIRYNKPQELINGEVIIYNLLGQEVTRKKLETITTNQINIPVQNTCYLVRINYSGKTYTQKVIVRSL